MADLKKFEGLIESLIQIQPPLPGSMSEQYKVCGKPRCRCKDENNPRPHGPYHQVSYTLNRKSSSLSVKPGEVDDVRKMNESYKNLRSLLVQLSEESVSLCRESGVSEARRQMSEAISRAKSKLGASRRSQKPPLYLLRSRDKWKQKALQRKDSLEKNRIRIRDLNKSREKWRNEALRLRNKSKKLQQSQVADEKRISELKSSLEACKDNKKNS